MLQCARDVPEIGGGPEEQGGRAEQFSGVRFQGVTLPDLQVELPGQRAVDLGGSPLGGVENGVGDAAELVGGAVVDDE